MLGRSKYDMHCRPKCIWCWWIYWLTFQSFANWKQDGVTKTGSRVLGLWRQRNNKLWTNTISICNKQSLMHWTFFTPGWPQSKREVCLRRVFTRETTYCQENRNQLSWNLFSRKLETWASCLAINDNWGPTLQIIYSY